MPGKIVLDDSSYEGNMDMALGWLEEHAPWWTHKEASDPGITLIELWAILSDMQSYYMDRIQESHYRKYLKLLGMEEDNGCGAEVWVTIENVKHRQLLWKGTKLLADDMVFEAAEETVLVPNALTAFYIGEISQGDLIGNMRLSRKNSFRLGDRGNETSVLFTMELERPLESGGIFSFYILLDERRGRRPAADSSFRMGRISWQYLTGTGWRTAEEMQDATQGLLYSGMVKIRTAAEMIKERPDGGYPLRCVLTGGSYDIMPVLYKIKLNMVKAVQRDTLCMEEYLDYNGEETFCIRQYLGLTGSVDVYVKQAGGNWMDFGKYCRVTEPAAGRLKERYVFFSREVYGRVPPRGRRTVKLVYGSPVFREQYTPFDVSGVALQKLTLPWKNIDRSSVKLMLKQDEVRGLYREYVCTDAEEDRVSRAWHWEEEEDQIILGDGRHGEIPRPVEKAAVFTSLALVRGQEGNISCGKINRFKRPDLFPGLICSNELGGQGGTDRKKASEQFKALSGGGPMHRAVTAQDYVLLALETPGLVIKEAQAEMTPQGAVKICIRLPEPEMSEKCIRKYREQVSAFLEGFRAVTVPVIVEAEWEVGNDEKLPV